MSIDCEWLEQQFESESTRKRRGRDGGPPAHPPRPSRPVHRPHLTRWRRWEVGEIGRSYPKRPCPDPITPHPPTFRHLAALCAARTDLMGRAQAHRSRPALLALTAHRRDWIRSPSAWEPPAGDAAWQLGSLARHLLADYDVPRFLDAAWTAGLTPDGAIHQGWFKQVGAGRSFRAALGLPFPLSRRVAHHVLLAPDDLEIRAAFRYGQVVALGGEDRLARSLAATRLGAHFAEPDFWASVIRWFVAHPEVEPSDHGPIVDFLHHEKFVASVPNPATRLRGQPRQPLLAPPQPDLSMKGRTAAALLRAVAGWHRRLHARPIEFHEWHPSGIRPLMIVAGVGAARRVYETTELICTLELQDEGQAMHHCVAAYGARCRTGQVAIWSLTVEDATGRVDRLLTLELRGAPSRLVQAKGRCNRQPTVEELTILARWAEQGGPELSSWLRMPLAAWGT